MSSFSSGRFAVYKNSSDKKLKKKSFSSLKNSVHVEPVWFSLDNLTLCAALTTAQWYCTRLKKISDALKLFSYERDDFFIVFLKNRDKLSTKQKKFRSWTSDTVWHEIFAGSNYYDFAIFPAIRKNNSPPKKINGNIFPAKIYSRSSIKYALTKIYYTKIQH